MEVCWEEDAVGAPAPLPAARRPETAIVMIEPGEATQHHVIVTPDDREVLGMDDAEVISRPESPDYYLIAHSGDDAWDRVTVTNSEATADREGR